jgi:hypothetical protein
MTTRISDDPALEALARALRATFTNGHQDLWTYLPAPEQSEYLGYALTQLDWLRRYGFALTSSCRGCPFRPTA